MPLTLSDAYLDVLMPSHIVLDKDARIRRMGPSLLFHLGCDPTGHKLSRFFKTELFEHVRDKPHEKATRQLQLHGRNEGEGLLLRGTAVPNTGQVHLMIRHVPVSPSAEDRRPLRFDDFSPTDSAMDMQVASKLYFALMHEAQTLCQEVTKKRILADAANVAKSQFLATMSHELRTPLNGILGMAQVLSGRNLDKTDADMVNVILSSGEALLAILNDVLDMTKMEAGQFEIDPQDDDFAQTVTRIAKLFQASAEQKGLGFSLSIADDFPILARIDAHRAGQCVSNIVSNAIKFTDTGSISITLSSEAVADGYIFHVAVRDTGVGISQDQQETLFEPFTQADSSTTREYGGTGLGLSIARKMITIMGGALKVDSEQGRGSTFTLSVPAQRPQSDIGEDFVTDVDSALKRYA
ncbi:MAG: sensor histidine kinase [Litorimonas sp.]